MSFLLGIEIGTTRIKIGIFNLDGRLILEESAKCQLLYNAETTLAETPVLDWFTKIKGMLVKIKLSVPLSKISSICIGSHGPTLVALDKSLNPVCNSILWLDKRAKDEVYELSKKLNKYIPEAMTFVPKAMWLQNNNPEIFNKVAHFVQPLDYITVKLTGEISTSIGPNNIKIWDKDIISASKLDNSLFPKQIPMGNVVGYVSSHAAKVTGLKKGTPVISGTGGADCLESLISSGGIEKGVVIDRGGSSQGINICWDKVLNIPLYYQSEHPLLKGYYHISSVMNTTGKSLEWFKNISFGASAKYERLFNEAKISSPGSKGLLFIPNLADSMMSKDISNGFSSVFYGLTLEHTRRDLSRAILEGTAYGINSILKTFKDNGATASKIIATGGQARSDLWNQIKADITNLPVVVNKDPDGSTLGLAIIAGVGAGFYNNIVEASKLLISHEKEFLPNPNNREIYDNLQGKYIKLSNLLKNIEQS